jgi:uncharacterized protein involved in response to NO
MISSTSTIAITTGGETRPDFLAAPRARSGQRQTLAFAAAAMLFMLVPGTLVGVLNLISIGAEHTPGAISRAWVQAHGHAQIFGWLGTLILGIGYASLPRARKLTFFGVDEAWVSLALWTSGALLRWTVGFEPSGWRLTLPLAAGLELAGFALFFRASSGHRPESSERPGAWAIPVIGGTVGLLFALVAHAWLAVAQAFWGTTPTFPDEPNGRLLALTVWGFLAPFVWGFTARWVCPLLGVARVRGAHLVAGYALGVVGVGLAIFGLGVASAVALLVASVWVAFALRLFEPAAEARPAERAFRAFARASYVWLAIGAGIGVWASLAANPSGIVGASRHALTVGFLATMVFTIGPRILPALAGAGRLFSPTLGTLALVVLTVGCATRVVAQILAYQGYAAGAWSWLPVSALTELAAFTTFFANLAATVVSRRR